MTKRHLTAAALASALVLSACGNGSDTASTGSSNEHGGGHSSSDNKTDNAKGNDADISFAAQMIPHHAQAVEMSEIILTKNPLAEVAALATQIKDAQAPEIKQLETILADLGESTDPAEHSEHGSSHGGMMSDAEMAELKAATGTEAVKLWLEAMIAHHEGAIEASETQIADGKYRPAIELATQIRQAQAAEIAEMEHLLAQL
jgi:uncharacterized protein (DUF305 family)